ncbi:MAG TPA: HAD hydrolase family protein [Gemmatimonadales bacterium]|nr:HAD hydrolase family protein [Gemmatimonadales bacterium]
MIRPEELTTDQRERIGAIRAVLTDCDGVLTDAGIYYSMDGEELRRFSVRDGMGVERLRAVARIETIIVTRENSGMIARRGEKLRVEVLLGARDKLPHVRELLAKRSLTLAQCAYIGDDVNDLELLRAVGLSACPADAEPEVRQSVQLVCGRPGGHGAFRELAELILAVQSTT